MSLQARVSERSREDDKAKTESLDLGSMLQRRATLKTQHLSMGLDPRPEADSRRWGHLVLATTLLRVIPPRTQPLEVFLCQEDQTQLLLKEGTLQDRAHTTLSWQIRCSHLDTALDQQRRSPSSTEMPSQLLELALTTRTAVESFKHHLSTR